VAEAWLPKGGGASQRCFGVFYLVVVNYLIRCWNLINIFLSFTFSLFTNCVCLCVCVCSLSVSFTLAIAVSFWLRQAFHAGRESDPKAYELLCLHIRAFASVFADRIIHAHTHSQSITHPHTQAYTPTHTHL